MNIKLQQNNGIISTGDHTQNTLIQTGLLSEIDWARLKLELAEMYNSPDPDVRQFAADGTQAVKENNTEKMKAWLLKWAPRIGKLIETSYYIVELARNLGVL